MRKSLSILFSAVLLLIGSAQGSWAQKVYDLGTYPGGDWAQLEAINDFGVAVGVGDVPGGSMHPLAVQLFGPNASRWDLGTLGGEAINCTGIANTGLIVGSSANTQGLDQGFWRPLFGEMKGLDSLPGDTSSVAYGVNKLGTFIVGDSYGDLSEAAVVWTPEVVWKQGKPAVTWKIRKLDVDGEAYSVNNSGQIVGIVWDDFWNYYAVIWNPLPGGKGWRSTMLPASQDYPNAWAAYINERGEIVGAVISAAWDVYLPALWRPNPQGKTWELTLLPTLSGLAEGVYIAFGINDFGDIVGSKFNPQWGENPLAVRWSTKDPNFVQLLGFPGERNTARCVNNLRIAGGRYKKQLGVKPDGTPAFGPNQAVAVKFH